MRDATLPRKDRINAGFGPVWRAGSAPGARSAAANLPYDHGNPDLCAELAAKDAHGLLVAYHNWMSLLVRATPREVKRSKAFQANPLAQERAAELAAIIGDIEQGRDPTRYLSRGIKNAADLAGKPLGERRDFDLMLNDWGVHHLHVSTRVERDGFVKRSGSLLFAVFRPGAAYLIDIMRHGDWTREHVIHVLADEWPDEGVIHEVRGVSGLARTITEDERLELRRRAVNTFVEIGGRVFMPEEGMVTTGTTVAATRDADQVFAKLQDVEAKSRAEPRFLKELLARHGIEVPDEPKLEFIISEQGCGVLETATGTLLLVD